LSANQPAVFFFFTPNQHQAQIFFSHNKSTPATSHSQTNNTALIKIP